MRFLDMLRMSAGNLWKRKIRTVLTILGVVIGTASIVVMISIGLGLDKATVEQMSSYGSMTTINVYPNYNGDTQADPTSTYLSLDDVKLFESFDHVDFVSPVLSFSAYGFVGKYTGYMELRGMTVDALDKLNLELEAGHVPNEDDDELCLLYGNQVIIDFYNERSEETYWETGVVPDIDFMNDTVKVVFNMDEYWSYKYPAEGTTPKKPKKYPVATAGVLAGGLEEYGENAYSVLCDISKLEAFLHKVFKKAVIPGQPSTKSGKPYKDMYYQNIVVSVDDMNNVTEVQKAISELGYNASSNMEWLEYSQQQYAYIEAVLGGIGAVAMLVAAISIANTMMMSIYERTKEIGIMKVLGCNMHNIQTMFLLEAAFIGVFGGVFGIGFSFVASKVVNLLSAGGSFMGVSTGMSYIPPWLCLLGIGFAIIVSTIAGFFPSLRAMKLSPLAAIRNE